ncbi:MAG TPA: N-acetylmuramoyl-L-alanine amidase [Vicinamibacterales bacterium]|nr:N-acetylmuramoyl-L-alanine amidase [Vicinamibacterales bacterium]
MLLALLAIALGVSSVVAQEADRDLYNAALVRERAVRATFSGTPAPQVALKDIHAIVTAYQTLVRRFPASGYSDDALWQAGRLELDAFARFGEARDREIGTKLLQRLAADYPTSKLARRVPDTLNPRPAEPPPAPMPVKAAAVRPAPAPVKPAPAPAASQVPTATIRTVTRRVLPDVVRVVIELDREVPFHDERIADPDRLFVDLSPTQTTSALSDQTLRFTADSDIVRQVRLGRQSNRTTRIVLDAGGVSTYSIYALYEPYRLVIDCVRAARPAPPPPPIAGKYFIATWARKLPTATAHGAPLLEAVLATAPPPPDPPAPAPAAAATLPPAAVPDRNATGGFSMARQLGLGVSRIVIDPGHGGHDPGAMGNGVSEAELVLDIALRVEKLLSKQPGTEVVLTRKTDDFVSLAERTALANRESADLFLSIHANASEDGSVRGIETYFLNFANNLSAAAVAARENAASGQSMGALPDFVKAIALNNKLDESRDFATYVQRSMIEKLRATNKTTKDLGVKQAPFVVLIGAAMPSVLAEISFVTNPQEAKLLKSSAYRQRIADALFAAIRKYQTSLHSISGQAASVSEAEKEFPQTPHLPAKRPPPAGPSSQASSEERRRARSDPYPERSGQ